MRRLAFGARQRWSRCQDRSADGLDDDRQRGIIDDCVRALRCLCHSGSEAVLPTEPHLVLDAVFVLQAKTTRLADLKEPLVASLLAAIECAQPGTAKLGLEARNVRTGPPAARSFSRGQLFRLGRI